MRRRRFVAGLAGVLGAGCLDRTSSRAAESDPTDASTGETPSGTDESTVATRTPDGETGTERTTASPDELLSDRERLDARRDVVVRNHDATERTVAVTATTTVTPACRQETPACGRPARSVTVIDERLDLAPDEETTLPGTRYAGTYALSAALAGGDAVEFDWRVAPDRGRAVVSVRDGSASITQVACDPEC